MDRKVVRFCPDAFFEGAPMHSAALFRAVLFIYYLTGTSLRVTKTALKSRIHWDSLKNAARPENHSDNLSVHDCTSYDYNISAFSTRSNKYKTQSISNDIIIHICII